MRSAALYKGQLQQQRIWHAESNVIVTFTREMFNVCPSAGQNDVLLAKLVDFP